MGGARGRLVSHENRLEAIALTEEAHKNGARKHQACSEIGVSIRTLARWKSERGAVDKRKEAFRVVGNKLSPEERMLILSIVNSEKYRDLSPNKIVPMLADEEKYVASESSFYRILREEKQLTHRGKSKPANHKRPDECVATAPNQLWSWDITYLPSPVLGEYFYLYMMVDVFSRKIVGWSVHDSQSAEHAAQLVKQACIDEKIQKDQITLHSDNGSPMKGLTMLAMLQVLGITASFSRPSVSDDNPFSEALFRTVKYYPTFPTSSAFASITEARKWCIAFACWYNP